MDRIAKAVFYWQIHPATHPLTCGNDDCKPLPYFENQERKLYYHDGKLKCFHCDYEQDHIPDVVIEFYEESYKK